MPQTTLFLNGTLRLRQPERGYRFSLDAPILADFIRCGSGDTMLEIGAGIGIIPLILFIKRRFCSIVAVEIQNGLAELAAENVCLNGAADKIQVIHGDVRTLGSPPLPRVVDIVFSNPPYRPLGRGLLNPNPERAVARHELFLTLPELMLAAWRFLAPGGKFFLIHLAQREDEVRREAALLGFHLGACRRVFAFQDNPDPTMVLFCFHKRVLAEVVQPPLVIYEKERCYSAEFQSIIGAETAALLLGAR